MLRTPLRHVCYTLLRYPRLYALFRCGALYILHTFTRVYVYVTTPVATFTFTRALRCLRLPFDLRRLRCRANR